MHAFARIGPFIYIAHYPCDENRDIFGGGETNI